jgi:hypothetical protein
VFAGAVVLLLGFAGVWALQITGKTRPKYTKNSIIIAKICPNLNTSILFAVEATIIFDRLKGKITQYYLLGVEGW